MYNCSLNHNIVSKRKGLDLTTYCFLEAIVFVDCTIEESETETETPRTTDPFGLPHIFCGILVHSACFIVLEDYITGHHLQTAWVLNRKVFIIMWYSFGMVTVMSVVLQCFEIDT